jgi:hypothetical protein
MATNLQKIMSFLTGKGLTPAQAAGVAGNWTVESSLNPNSVNRAEGAVGLGQWENGRLTNLQNFARARGKSEGDFQTQLDFAWSELQGSENVAYRALLTATTPAEAATIFDKQYERSAGTSRAERIADANAIAAGKDPSHNLNDTITDVVTDPVGAVTGAFSGWQTSALDIGLKVAAVAVAGGLLVVGAKQTVNGSAA